MSTSEQDLQLWLERIRLSKSRQEIFKKLDEFRGLPWTDEQCALMSKHYIRLLDGMAPTAADTTASGPEVAEGPVWYEKM